MDAFAAAYGAATRELTETLLRIDTAGGNEAPAADALESTLADHGFDTYRWEADPERLAEHPSFPDDPADIPAAGRPSVAGVLEAGDHDAGPTLVLDGHLDVVPASEGAWTGDPFEPRWDDGDLTARGAADMKAGLAACVFAARHAVDVGGFDGRVVVEGVAGEEDGGVGAAAAALDSPYPFERDAAIVAEPTDLRPVVATEGSAMMRLELEGRPAHAATAWRGESVLPRFEAVRRAFEGLAAQRNRRVTHPLYAEFPEPWPAVCGRVRAGEWASTVPADLVAEWRLGVAPGETVAEVVEAYRERLAEVASADPWLAAHPPTFERFSVQFEPAEIAADEPVVRAVRAAMAERDLAGEPRGATYGADSRHFVAAGIPAVLFGPGPIEQAHFPDETVAWDDVLTAGATLSAAVRRYCGGPPSS